MSAPDATIDAQDITGLILAGGRGQRMGGADKGLQNFNGVPLALHTLMRLQPQVGQLMVNANRNLSAYESFGVPVWPDAHADYAGPLAGFLAGLEQCETNFLLTVPCDTPLFATDLVARLADGMCRSGSDIAMVAAPETGSDGTVTLRTQPVFCLLHVSLLESLVRFTQAGGRKIDAWTAQHPTALVAFDTPRDHPLAFANANTLSELHTLEAALL